MDFSCIYVNYNSAAWLEKSLETLFRTETDPRTSYEVIVVNNDRREEASLQALAARYPFRVVGTGDNEGFGRAVNRGTALAEGAILFFVNPDTEWKKPFLSRARQQFEKEPTLGILGVPLSDGVRFERNGGKFLTLFQGFANHLPFLSAEPPEWVSGAAMFIPRDLFRAVGGFDERFFLYFEDMDLCKRVRERSRIIGLLEGAELVHHGGKSHRERRLQKDHYDASLRLYTEKHFPPFQANLFSTLLRVYRWFFPYGC